MNAAWFDLVADDRRGNVVLRLRWWAYPLAAWWLLRAWWQGGLR